MRLKALLTTSRQWCFPRSLVSQVLLLRLAGEWLVNKGGPDLSRSSVWVFGDLAFPQSRSKSSACGKVCVSGLCLFQAAGSRAGSDGPLSSIFHHPPLSSSQEWENCLEEGLGLCIASLHH